MELKCRDEKVIPATPEAVYDALTDLSTYERWMTTMRVEPLGAACLAPGERFRFSGVRDDGAVSMSWVVEAESLVPESRIDLRYAEGDLVGPVGWELEAVDGGTRTAYVYRGVSPTNPAAAAPFERYGLRVHNLAMQAALDGLSRHILGQPLGDAWRDEVSARMEEAIAQF